MEMISSKDVKSLIVSSPVKMLGELLMPHIWLKPFVNVKMNNVQVLGNVMMSKEFLLISLLIMKLMLTKPSIQKMPSILNITEYLSLNVILTMMDLLKSVKFGNVLKLPNKSGEMKTVHSGLKLIVNHVHGDGKIVVITLWIVTILLFTLLNL
jgi:hypothetical protein